MMHRKIVKKLYIHDNRLQVGLPNPQVQHHLHQLSKHRRNGHHQYQHHHQPRSGRYNHYDHH